MSDQPIELRIRHSTEFHYELGAAASFNEARMTPLTTSDQLLLRSRLDIRPSPWMFEYTDYWGTSVTAFQVQEPHGDLSVVASSTVQTRGTGPAGQGIGWHDLDAVQDEHCELLELTDRVRPADGLVVAVDALRTDAATPADLVRAVVDLVRGRLEYRHGATEVTTPAADVWEEGAGVCQDLTHVTIGALRHARVPARYVSGYLHPSRDPQIGETVEAEPHAWVEYWDGAWVGIDPTSGGRPGAGHVVVARGRDYGDNPPLRGIYSTAGGSEMSVAVEITRTA